MNALIILSGYLNINVRHLKNNVMSHKSGLFGFPYAAAVSLKLDLLTR